MMDSLSKILRERAGIFTCFDSEATDTASVGPSAGAQGERRGQGDGWNQPVDGEPDDQGRGDDQPDGQRQHRAFVLPQRLLVEVFGLVVQKRGYEQH